MKKVTLILSAALMFAVLTNCSSGTDNGKTAVEFITVNGSVNTNGVKYELAEGFDSQLLVGKENFKKLVAFIEKNGSVAPVCPSLVIHKPIIKHSYQYKFTDKRGDLLEMMTINKDANGIPSCEADATVKEIRIWGYEKDTRDNKHQFEYAITVERIMPDVDISENIEKQIKTIARSYKDLLAKAY